MLQCYISPESSYISALTWRPECVLPPVLGEGRWNEIGQVNGGKYPERNQLDMFKSAGYEKSYYVVIWELWKEYLDMFFPSFAGTYSDYYQLSWTLPLLSFVAVEATSVQCPWTKQKSKQCLCSEGWERWWWCKNESFLNYAYMNYICISN